MMRIWLLALASCWTGAAATQAVVTPPRKVQHAWQPDGLFVPNLIAHRVATRGAEPSRAIDLDVLGGQRAILEPSMGQPMPVPTKLDGLGPSRARPMPAAIKLGFRAAPAALLVYATTDTRVVVEYCIDAMGHVVSAHLEIQGDGTQRVALPSDREILARLREWQFAPYFVDGAPVTACSYVDYSVISP